MQKNFLTLLLAGSILTTSAFATEQTDITDYIAGKNRLTQIAMSERGFVGRVWDNSLQRVSDFKDSSTFCYQTGKKCLTQGDVGSVLTELFEASLKSTSEQFFKNYFHGQLQNSEFDVEALRPLVENVQNIFCNAIEGLLMKQPLYAYDQKTGSKLKIYEDKTVFRKLLGALVPDAVPLKGLMLSLADASPIRTYVVRKIDELTIHYLLQCYHLCTGKTVKSSVSDILNSLTNSKRSENSSTEETITVIDNVPLSLDDNQTLELSENIIESDSSEKIDVLNFLERNTKSNLDTISVISDELIIKDSQELSSIWAYLEPRVTHLLRNAVTEVMLPTFNKSLEELTLELQHKVIPQGNVIGTLLTTAGVTGSMLLLPATFAPMTLFGLVGGYYATTFGTQVVTKTLIDYAAEHKELYTKYYLDSFLPESKKEHLLYGLNALPTEAEKDIFLSDYYHQALQWEEGLARAVLNDLSKVSYIGGLINKMVGSVKSNPVVHSEKTNDDYAPFLLGGILTKLKNSEKLNSEDEKLLRNLQSYPSYAIKQTVSGIVNQWKNSKTAEFKKYSQEQKKQQQQAEKNLIDLYNLYQNEIPTSIAAAYQGAGQFEMTERFSFDFIKVEEIIQQNFAANLKTLSHKELDVLKRAMKEDQFLVDFLKAYLDKNAKRDEVQKKLKSRDFLEQMAAKYIEHFGATYIKKNKSEFQTLKESSLGFGLSDIELIELHRRMTKEDTQTHLEQSQLKIEAEKKELAIVKQQVDALVAENKQDVLTHYADQLIKQLNMDDVFNWASKNKVLNFEELEPEKLAKIQTKQLKNMVLANLPIGTAFRTQLKEFLGEAERTEVYSLIMTKHFYPYLIKRLEQKSDFVIIDQKSTESIFEQKTENTKETFSLSSFFNSSVSDKKLPLSKNESTESIPGGEKASIKVTAYGHNFRAFVPTSGTDQGIYNKVDLVNILNTLYKDKKIKDIFQLKDEEIKLVHQEIISFKKNKIYDLDVLEFVKNEATRQEMMVVSMEKLQENSDLFYSFSTVYQDIMKQKKQAVAVIMKQSLKK